MEQLTQLTLPGLDVIAFLVVIAGVVSWGGVEIFKKAIAGLLKYHKIEAQPWWHASLCRVISVVLGFGVGYMLCSADAKVCGLIGCAAGALNSFVVMLLKKYLKKKVDKDE